MKNVQTRTIWIIFKIFRNTTSVVLNVELHLLSIQNQMNITLYNVILRIIINSVYSYIKIQRILLNCQFIFEQIQHQKLYVQFNSLLKLEICYAAMFKRDLNHLELRISFLIAFWKKISQIIITKISKETIAIHETIRIWNVFFIIYIDNNEINEKIKISTMTFIIFVTNQISMIIDKR